MIKFLIKYYDSDHWSPRDWDKYTNDPVTKEYVIDYMKSRYGDYIMVINYLTIRGHYIIDTYSSEEGNKVNRYYITEHKHEYSNNIWIDRKILLRESILDKLLN